MTAIPELVHHAPGDETPIAKAGDFILTHSTFLTGRLIRFGQRLRFRGEDRRFAYYNHAALVIHPWASGQPVLAEALGRGVEKNPLSKYEDTEYVLVRTGIDARDRFQVLKFAYSVLDAKTRYDYLEILSLGLTLAVPLPVQFGSPGTSICSGFVAEALTRAGHVFGTSPEYCMPADLARHFNVEPGTVWRQPLLEEDRRCQ